SLHDALPIFLDRLANEDASLQDIVKLAAQADNALIVWDYPIAGVSALRKHGFTPFMISDCPLLFAASYELPKAPWLHVLQDVAYSAQQSQSVVVETQKAESGLPEQAPASPFRQGLEQVTLVTKSATVVKSEDGAEERYILGIVLEPNEVDSQGDTISEDEIRRAAHRYMEEHGNVGLQHTILINEKAKVIESYIAPTSFEIEGQAVKKGTWLMAFHVIDDEVWNAAKSGVIGGLSMGGTGTRTPLA